MTRAGLQHPQVVDLITRDKDGTVRLILAKTLALTGNHVLALQEKLKNYLELARGGTLAASYPGQVQAVRIRVDLYATPDALILEFLRRFRQMALKDAVEVELSVNQIDVTL